MRKYWAPYRRNSRCCAKEIQISGGALCSRVARGKNGSCVASWGNVDIRTPSYYSSRVGGIGGSGTAGWGRVESAPSWSVCAALLAFLGNSTHARHSTPAHQRFTLLPYQLLKRF